MSRSANPAAAVLCAIDARGVATVTLNNPDKRNAFDDRIIRALTDTFSTLQHRAAVKVMVLASTGSAFSAGADLGWMQRMASYSYAENCADADALAELMRCLDQLPFPTIARVQGAAYGGAVGLVSCCDIAVASTRASFCLSEVRIGLLPATISPYVINAIGSRAARRYFTTAEVISAERACALGLVSELVAPDALDSAVEQLVQSLLGNSPAAVRAAKQLVADMAGQPLSPALIADTSGRIAAIRVSAEGQEGLQAFLQKRPPAWQAAT
jgi:methylglutaconyl-CoA hydratase